MERDLLSLVFSLFTLFMCIYFFIIFNNYKNTPLLKINEDLLLSNKTTICRDTDNRFDCQPILTENKLIKYDRFKTSVYLSKDALICNDVDRLDTCICLKKHCNHYRDIFEPTKSVTLINDSITFSPTNSLYYTGRTLPIPDQIKPTNTFSLAFYINISKIDEIFPRTLISWDNFKLSIMPYQDKCSSKLFLQLNSLYDDGIFSNSCIKDMTYFNWNHIVIQGSGNILEYYFNGQPSDKTSVYKDFNLGNIDKYFIIGQNCPGISISNMYWFNDLLTTDQINYLVLEKLIIL